MTAPAPAPASSPPALPQPTELERWVGEGGWLVELLLPRTDAGVLFQVTVLTVVFALLLRPARRAELFQLWLGGAVFTTGVLMLRAAH